MLRISGSRSTSDRLPDPRLQRLQEGDQLITLCGAQRAIVVDYARRLARVTQDRFVEGQCLSIVHVAIVCAAAPQWRGAQLVARRLPAVLDDAVARADVMQQEVTERMDGLIAQRVRD